jgi:ABC-type uncharacterized transport system permease subunit
MDNFIVRFLLAITALLLFDIFVKPIAAQNPTINLIINVILAVVLIYIVISSAIQFQRKLQSFEPEQRSRYLKRNGVVLALFVAYIVGLVGWGLYFR